MQYSNQHGEFENNLHGNIVVSEYSGNFDEKGIHAIFSEIESLTSGLEYWCWHQIPHPKTKISETGVAEMLNRYTKIHVHGCVAIGVSFTNPEINRVSLPKDGTLKVLFKVSRNKTSLDEFFQQALKEAKSANIGELQIATTAKARKFDIIKQFLTATHSAGLHSDELKQLVGFSKPQLDALPNLDRDTSSRMQAITAMLGIVAFKVRPDSIHKWMHTPLSDNQSTPFEMCLEQDGLYELFKQL
ncbi:hypothetical protein [Aestuariibacter salexigens]|uniref:hypothetical protein n=1 Tax=Aestuariibacter salexigens TaxID=226010 RepID=UPI000420E8A9|nr:hypothetical protein [Aestuariibacter salexigens]